jgi:hypothetical protein
MVVVMDRANTINMATAMMKTITTTTKIMVVILAILATPSASGGR